MTINNRIDKIGTYVPSITPQYRKGIDLLKLDWNEPTRSVISWSETELIEYLAKHVPFRYPPADDMELSAMVSSYVETQIELINLYSGSDAALSDIFNLLLNDKTSVGVFVPTYNQVFPLIRARTGKIKLIEIGDPFGIHGYDFDQIRGLDVVYLPNPNNPTGICVPKERIKKLLDQNPKTLFIIDEAYSEYTATSASEYVNTNDNIIITRSLSKAFGLPGIRFGYTISSHFYAKKLNSYRNAKQISTTTRFFAKKAFSNLGLAEMNNYVEEVTSSRKIMFDYFNKRKVPFSKSEANFILFTPNHYFKFMEDCEAHGLLLRARDNDGQVNQSVRMTLGDKETTSKTLKIFELIQSI